MYIHEIIKSYRGLTESTSLEATIKAIIADIGNPVSSTYATLSQMAEKFAYNKGSLKGFGMIAGGAGNRWYQTFYFNRLQKELYDLAKYVPRHSEALKRFLEGSPNSFTVIGEVLPPILIDIAQKINNQQLAAAARRWVHIRNEYYDLLDRLKNDGDEEDDTDIKPISKPPAPKITGQQASQAEQLVSDILRSLPKNVAGDIRNAIARMPNKLQALQQELQKRNIKL